MKMTLARLKMITRRVHIAVSVFSMVLIQMKHGCMETGFIRQIFGHEVKATERSPPDNLTRWIITQPKGLTRKGIEKINRSVMAYVYLVLSSQVQARSTIVCNYWKEERMQQQNPSKQHRHENWFKQRYKQGS